MRHILAIDQGTTNTKVCLFDERAALVAQASRPVPVAFPRAGWVEQDGDVIWRSVEDAIADCLARVPASAIAAVAVTNQRESILLWERSTGRPVAPVIVWQCRRTEDFCQALRERGLRTRLEATTGLTIDPLFSASKLRWLLDHVPGATSRAEHGELCAGTIDSWLIWNLTGGTVHACDATNASRTQLLNLRSALWDAELLSLFSIPAAILPAVRPSSCIFGQIAAIRGLEGVPIASAIGDSHAALFGHAAFAPGQVKATYGTGSSLMTVATDPVQSRHGLSTTIAWHLDRRPQHALEGNITVTGSAVEWVSQIVGLGSAGDAGALAQSIDDSSGVYFVPALAGLGAPYWDANARGLVSVAVRPPPTSRERAWSRSPTRFAMSSTRFARTPGRRPLCLRMEAPPGMTRSCSFRPTSSACRSSGPGRSTCPHSAPRGSLAWPSACGETSMSCPGCREPRHDSSR
jgi:glycerol kinase